MTEERRLGGPFWRFWGAAVLANVGDGIRAAAFPLLAAALTDDALAVGAVAAAQTLPWLVTGLWAGALADRRGARALIVGADAGRAVVLGLLVAALALGWLDASGGPGAGSGVWVVAGCAFLLGIAETVRDTAAQAALPRLLGTPERLERANGRLVAGEVVGNEFVGPPVGAALFAAGAALPFAANGAALALAAMLVLSLPLSLARPAGALAATSPVGDGVRAGLRWLGGQRMLRALVASVAAVAAADAAWFAIFVLYAREELGLGAGGFGALLACGAVGGVLGSLLADRLVAGRRHRAVLAWALGITAGVPALLVPAAHLGVAVAVTVVTSGSFAVLNVCAVSLRQRAVPDALLGRVTAAARTLTLGATALGALAGGLLARGGGLDAPFLACGVVAVLATALWWRASSDAAGAS
ncbi:MFS transporter [Streptomyces sp. 4N509B]|uniref:MFS transporter n=1 Tax=Streptomyces sp. 4N509B TaxID=3457413 RepID=UPI003FD3D1C4